MIEIITLEQTDFSPECRQLLIDYLAPLDKEKPGYSTRTLNYLLNGDDESLLADIATFKYIDSILLIQYPTQHAANVQFLNKVQSDNVEFFVRLARLFSVCVDKFHATLYKSLPFGQGYYLDPFIFITVNSHSPYRLEKELFFSSFKLSMIEKMLNFVGEKFEELLHKIYHGSAWLPEQCLYWALSGLVGFTEYSNRHQDIIISAIKNSKPALRAQAMELVVKRNVSIDQYIDLIVDLAVKSDKNARHFAIQLLQRNTTAAIPKAIAKLNSKKATERLHAVNLLWEISKEDAIAPITAQRAVEQDENVIAAIDQILSLQKNVTNEPSVAEIELPPIELNQPLSDNFKEIWKKFISARNQVAQNYYQENKQAFSHWQEPKIISEAETEKGFTLLQSGSGTDCATIALGEATFYIAEQIYTVVDKLVEHPEIELIHFLRLQIMLGLIDPNAGSGSSAFSWHSRLDHYFTYKQTTIDMPEISRHLVALGLDSGYILYCLLNSYWPALAVSKWDRSRLEGYLLENLTLLLALLSPNKSARLYCQTENTLNLLSIFSQLPDLLIPRLWEIAFTGNKRERELAQELLTPLPNCEERILLALKEKKADRRLIAAQWLVNLPAVKSIDKVTEFFKNEPQESIKAALLKVLEQSGAPLDQFFDRDKLQQEALTNLEKAYRRSYPGLT